MKYLLTWFIIFIVALMAVDKIEQSIKKDSFKREPLLSNEYCLHDRLDERCYINMFTD